MSLVYDALRQPATDAAVVAAGSLPPQAAAPWTQALAGYRRPALWLLCGMLVAGPVGFLLSRPAADTAVETIADAEVGADADAAKEAGRAPVPAIPATIAAIDTAMPSTTGNALEVPAIDAGAASAPVASNPAATTAALPAQPATEAGTASAATGITPDMAVAGLPAPAAEGGIMAPGPGITAAAASPQVPVAASAAPAAAAIPAAQAPARTDVQVVASQIQLSVRKADASTRAAASEEADANAVRGAMAELNAAVGEHDAEATAAAIARLQALLPAESLTLLRARAWAAHGQGDYPRAEQLYRAILDRVPDDEHAGVNLALLDARRGEMAEARARLDRMAARNARSPQIVQALAELDAARR
ncbi:hypothetical protein CSC62_03610 [Pseudoxanthomonas jiangsuensis]|uniref:tetratricopeptide repeat protein n=1 Tax=Pseudoxanthomonas jiangsuensis TaxID=619688 RepID=UPI0013919722|nr:tetratricopeptide repeat protein [Pseudoxanthomonas jiangsuensis]KAF1698651.1 hypothetical protein CSC62_03610 [Pseudoxanthomonas jiangsuensis]